MRANHEAVPLRLDLLLDGLHPRASGSAIVWRYRSIADTREVKDFAEERGLSIERPEVVPATSSAEITIVHSSTYESASTTWELADLLRALGSEVSLKRVRLKNHVVTGNRVGVFVRDESVSGHPDDDVGISELICSRDDEEAIVLLFEDGLMEVHTYLWKEDQVTGHNYSGRWRSSGEEVVLEPRNLGAIAFRATGDCITTPGVLGSECDAELEWMSGGSIPVLSGCPVIARNVIHAGFGSSTGGESICPYPHCR